MARRSRKGAGSSSEAAPRPGGSVRIWKCGVYARLSSRDNNDPELGSMDAQVNFVCDWVAERDDMDLAGVFIDNGRSGTTFEGRVEFERLMDAAREGEVDCIAVKDLSRFGRNMYETTTYLEKIFPFLGLRFVAINDGFDSLGGDGGIMVPFKGFVNEFYAAETSRKVSMSRRRMMEEGRPSAAFAPLGYLMDRKQGRYVPDEATAPVVAQVFEWAAEGMRLVDIAERLTQMGVPTPTQHRMSQSRDGSLLARRDAPWGGEAVSKMLRDPIYIGTLVMHKVHESFAERIPRHECAQEERIVIEGAHEPLVDAGLFAAVGEMASERFEAYVRRTATLDACRETHPNLFSGLLFAQRCGLSLTMRRSEVPAYYTCSTKEGACSRCGHTVRIPEGLLRIVVADALRVQVRTALAFERVLGVLAEDPRMQRARAAREAEVAHAEAEVARLSRKRERLYEGYAEGRMDRSAYQQAKLANDAFLREQRERLSMLESRLADFDALSARDEGWDAAVRAVDDLDTFSGELVHALVSRIGITAAGGVEIEFRFTDWAARADAVREAVS